MIKVPSLLGCIPSLKLYSGFKATPSNKNGISAGFDDLKWCTVHDYFSKISFNR